jgi:quercetin dioxygenase-like cupin family protein
LQYFCIRSTVYVYKIQCTGIIEMGATKWTQEAVASRLVRYQDLRPCTTAFIDTRTPGSEQKENFTIIGPGVAENPDQYVHIDIPHGFNIGAARQPAGCVNSQHSHETAEVFVVHTGRWRFSLGEHATDADIELGVGDTISIPTHVFRGFTNVGDGPGFLFAILGEDDPGQVTWAPHVFEAAKKHGLILLEDGRLIDTAKGETVPPDGTPMPATTADAVRLLQRMTGDEIKECVAREAELDETSVKMFGDHGLIESAIVGAENAGDGMPAGNMSWSHGFHLRRWKFDPGYSTPWHQRDEAEVILMQSGRLKCVWEGGELEMQAGDVLTAPIGLARQYVSGGDEPAIAYVVRGGDSPGGYIQASNGDQRPATSDQRPAIT